MALKKCKDCGHGISKRAKSCPNCGAPVKQPTSLGTILVAAFICWAVYSVVTSGVSRPRTGVAPSDQAARNQVEALFKSESEPTAQDAIWLSANTFSVGVLDNGDRRDGYAQYVCEQIRGHGIRGDMSVNIVDIVTVSQGELWETLGSARC